MKYESGNFFSLPNEIFLLGLNAGELAVYSFLRRCENRKTRQCWPSVKTIGKAVNMSGNTVRKYMSTGGAGSYHHRTHYGHHQVQRLAKR